MHAVHGACRREVAQLSSTLLAASSTQSSVADEEMHGLRETQLGAVFDEHRLIADEHVVTERRCRPRPRRSTWSIDNRPSRQRPRRATGMVASRWARRRVAAGARYSEVGGVAGEAGSRRSGTRRRSTFSALGPPGEHVGGGGVEAVAFALHVGWSGRRGRRRGERRRRRRQACRWRRGVGRRVRSPFHDHIEQMYETQPVTRKFLRTFRSLSPSDGRSRCDPSDGRNLRVSSGVIVGSLGQPSEQSLVAGREVWPQSCHDLTGGARREACDGPPFGAAADERSGDVHMNMRHGLMGRDPVVLPDRHATRVECAEDCCSSNERQRP